MSGIEKLINRFMTIPNDLSYNELVRVLAEYGFYEAQTGKTSGSRVRFKNNEGLEIKFHKPHQGKPVKTYVLKEIVGVLKEIEEGNSNHDKK